MSSSQTGSPESIDSRAILAPNQILPGSDRVSSSDRRSSQFTGSQGETERRRAGSGRESGLRQAYKQVGINFAYVFRLNHEGGLMFWERFIVRMMCPTISVSIEYICSLSPQFVRKRCRHFQAAASCGSLWHVHCLVLQTEVIHLRPSII